jgi:mono/diheme cytochrome c family protein
MKRFVYSMLTAALSLALAGAAGCGGGDKAAETTPAATEPAAPAEEPAPPAEEPAPAAEAPPAAEPAAPAGGGLTEQLAQADKVWADSCSTCHGDGGEGKGKKNPAVVGGKALSKYKTGGELLAYIKEKMPKDDPGSLTEADYLAATAWILSKNGKLGETSEALSAESAAAIQLK